MKQFLSALFVVFLAGSTLLPQQAKAQRSQSIILAGYKQKPPVATSGSGMATVTLRGDTLTVEGDFKNLTDQFSGAYIMVSLKRREGGNQLYTLHVDVNKEQTGGTFKAGSNSFVLSKAEKELLKKGRLYINVCSFEHDTGELRGDIALF